MKANPQLFFSLLCIFTNDFIRAFHYVHDGVVAL